VTADSRAERVDRLVEALRDQASRALKLHGAIADRLGLGASDMKALDLARAEQNLTAGRLAQVTGLSTSATTAVLDRLERRGLVHRRRDPHDRRRVVVEPTGTRDRELYAIFDELEADVRGVLADYDERELTLLLDLLSRLIGCAEQATRRVVESGPPG
jgi:DNA-binding MarR family transcriptional regulator